LVSAAAAAADTVRTPGWLDRFAVAILERQLGMLRSGAVEVHFPDGTKKRYGPSNGRTVSLHVHDWSFFKRVITGSDIGAGESYMDGHWWCDDLPLLLRLVIESSAFAEPTSALGRFGRRLHALARFGNANTLRGSRRNIEHHYDLGNNLYRLFLDETMMYSCAEFEGGATSLTEAQRRKIDGICNRLEIGPQHHVLEIGSGWGSFAMHAAREYGARVTTITLSQEQLALVRQKVAEATLADRVDVRLCDYRQATGVYDRIVSIEMFEAVGFEYYRAFFQACERLLRPGGRMFLQTITVPDQRFDRYRKSFDFIRKYIFPGGLLASVHEVFKTLRQDTDLRVDSVRDIGPYYARTLRAWRERFLAQLPEVRRLGYDERFVRMWEFYLACCEALFATRALGDAQIVLRRPAGG
jgi:cyclopropane-fatty-acyl-phospholipid synthase